MISFLTDHEREACQSLMSDTPYLIRGISTSMFSVARYSGGMKYDGKSYTYIPTTDECIRDDVLKLVMKIRGAAKKKTKPTETQTAIEFPE